MVWRTWAVRWPAGIVWDHWLCSGQWKTPNQARAVQYVIRRLAAFVGWVQGCDCHEEQLLRGQAVQCVFKGCRARSLARRVCQLLETIEQDRRALIPGQFGSVNVQDVQRALTTALSFVSLKLHWVHELPYLVWQAGQ